MNWTVSALSVCSQRLAQYPVELWCSMVTWETNVGDYDCYRTTIEEWVGGRQWLYDMQGKDQVPPFLMLFLYCGICKW